MQSFLTRNSAKTFTNFCTIPMKNSKIPKCIFFFQSKNWTANQHFKHASVCIPGVQYDITHIISRMCVVRQSTVLIPCKYTHPQHEQVSAVEWLHEKSQEKEVRVSQDPAFEGRVELQADAGNCSLLLRDVNESDAGLFRFVLSTGSGRNWTNAQGIRLEVTGE